MAAKTVEEISDDIRSRFLLTTGKEYRPGSALGFFNEAVSRSLSDAYSEIEKSKDPHIYTNLSGKNLDLMGAFVNVPRETDETDDDYLYRIMNWTYLKSASNLTAINDSLLNLTYASNAEYYPQVYGAGTGAIYVIPKDYNQDTINKALAEVRDRVKNVISPESYTEYIVPTTIPVTVVATIESKDGDLDYIKSNIELKYDAYINGIAPNNYLYIGTLNSLGLDTDGVDYFTVRGVYLNGKYVMATSIMQTLESKMLFNGITWED